MLAPPAPECLFRESFDWSSSRSGRNSSFPGSSGCCRRSGSRAGCWRPRSRSRKSCRWAGRSGSARRFVGQMLAGLESSRNRENLSRKKKTKLELVVRTQQLIINSYLVSGTELCVLHNLLLFLNEVLSKKKSTTDRPKMFVFLEIYEWIQ